MRKLHNALTLTLLLSLTLLIVPGCNEGDMKGVSDDLKNSLSTKIPDNYGWNYMEIDEGDIPQLCNVETLCLIAGQHSNVGSVTVGNDADGNLYVTYETNDGCKLTEIHLAVAATEEGIPQNKSGNPQIGHFAYNIEFQGDYPTSHSIKITTPDLDENGCAIIAAHAVVQCDDSGTQTAWGGPCDENGYTEGAMEFTPGKNGSWARYFQYCEEDNCMKEIDYTFAWEDLRQGNDADYNDVVIKSNYKIYSVTDTTKLELTYYLTARGAGYDHIFNVNIPITGDYRVNGGATITSSGEATVQIFASTKSALPANNVGINTSGANTSTQNTCLADPGVATVLVEIYNGGTLDGDAPFDPFIKVFPSGTSGSGASYDLHIYAITNNASDLFTFDDPSNLYPEKVDKMFPNGIFIPFDWKWPLERTAVWVPYTNFTSIDSWNTNWADSLDDPSKVFDKPNCP